MINRDARQADIFGLVTLEPKEEQQNERQRRSGDIEGVTPAEEPANVTGVQGGDKTADGVVGEPEAHDRAAFRPREESADIFSQRRPAGGLAEAL